MMRTKQLAVELARRLGRDEAFSDQCIRNWRGEGMPAVAREVASGTEYRYDPDACEKWARDNKTFRLHGGKRRGAGRKPVKPPGPGLDEQFRTAEQRADAARTLETMAARPDPPESGLRVDGLLNCSREELETLVRVKDAAGLTAAQVSLLRDLESARKLKRENDLAEGVLIDADAAAAETERLAVEARRAVLTAAGQIAQRLAVDLTLPTPSIAMARGIVEEELRRVCGEIAGNRQ